MTKTKITPFKLKPANKTELPLGLNIILDEIERRRVKAEKASHPESALGTINFGKELAYKEVQLLIRDFYNMKP